MRINRGKINQEPVQEISSSTLEKMDAISHQQDLREREKREAILTNKKYPVRDWVADHPGEPETCKTCPAAVEFENEIQCFKTVLFHKKVGGPTPCRVVMSKSECCRPGM
jgi:hypothetical protein